MAKLSSSTDASFLTSLTSSSSSSFKYKTTFVMKRRSDSTACRSVYNCLQVKSKECSSSHLTQSVVEICSGPWQCRRLEKNYHGLEWWGTTYSSDPHYGVIPRADQNGACKISDGKVDFAKSYWPGTPDS